MKAQNQTGEPEKMKKAAPVLFLAILLSASCQSESMRETPAVRVVKQTAASVVNIRTEAVVDLKEHPQWGRYGEELDRYFKDHYGEEYNNGVLEYKSVGSGILLNDKGFIGTNAHVVQKATSIFVFLMDGVSAEASLVRVNQEDDLAIIKADLPQGVKPVRLADHGGIMIGETVVAIGNPFGLENSVTVGVISGQNRTFNSPSCGYVCSGLLQTDAPINPGNSGGPLFNLDGELVGINLAVAQGAQNIGFAIPVHKVVDLLEREP
jgi:serine protease Do